MAEILSMRRKMMKTKIVLLCLALTAGFASAQVYPDMPEEYDFTLSDIAKSLTPVIGFNKNMHPANWVWKEGRSSALVEKGKPADFYEINKLYDDNPETMENDCSTAWVEGVAGDGIGEWVIIPVPPRSDELSEKLSCSDDVGTISVDLYFYNGYQKSKDLYMKNNRVRDAKITIYAAAVTYGQNNARLLWNPDAVHVETVTFNDDLETAPFYINTDSKEFIFTLPEKYQKQKCELYLKLEILSVYKGEKYSDTCISNMWAGALETADFDVE